MFAGVPPVQIRTFEKERRTTYQTKKLKLFDYLHIRMPDIIG
jgi:hypothetical protein